jgi:ribosomal protein L37AE/L43A
MICACAGEVRIHVNQRKDEGEEIWKCQSCGRREIGRRWLGNLADNTAKRWIQSALDVPAAV